MNQTFFRFFFFLDLPKTFKRMVNEHEIFFPPRELFLPWNKVVDGEQKKDEVLEENVLKGI